MNPVDSTIQLLNNWGQGSEVHRWTSSPGGGEGLLNKVLYMETLPGGPTPFLLTEKVPVSYNFHRKNVINVTYIYFW